ncbi:hypothetical protein PTSG_09378 [Salpingoeca rosetta]|uniref:DUF2723 domain-containing protein n=1 Tax=Salpingoeca rosetta (strain ATCC 50818 / BSB-021) TaxID=946362 RepID=F2UMG2_SALR5|nr:uncharacterized protein PTSG_09378 [Salpingoeca rosetta]EGD78311.1 hypothetical protein PTSG_09378 [Salpingoeca rosetta]|eukprot:XP_004989634.1 hypothetical protein PTSG_09378 [Salpingoeca rosetta]
MMTQRSAKRRGKRQTQKAAAAVGDDGGDGSSNALEYILLFCVQLGVFASTLYPSIPGGDSGELVSVACELGVAHPPGYPLYTLLCHMFMRIVPFGTPAWRANLLSATFASIAGTCIAWVTNKLSPPSMRGGGIVAAALFSFTRLTWMYSITAEVFAMNNFFVALLLVFLIRYIQSPSVSTAVAGAFVCALSTTNQHTVVLYLVVMVPWVLWHGRNFLLTPSAIAKLVVVSILGITPYFYVPISAFLNKAEATWGDQRTLAGFAKHFLRQEYGTFDLGSRSTTSTTLTERIMLHMKDLSSETHHIIFPLIAICVIAFAVDRRRVVRESRVPLVGMLTFYELFFNWRANLSIENRLLAGVHERFWMQPNMILCVFAGIGFSYLMHRLSRFFALSSAQALGVVAAVAVASVQIAANYDARDESTNTAVADMGRALLTGLPEEALLLTRGDLPGNAARYLHYCEHVRRDLRILDLEMMTYPWYVPMLGDKFEGVVFPGEKKVYQLGPEYYNMLSFLDSNYDRFPIFVFEGMNEEDTTWQHKYELRHFGMSSRIVRKGDRFSAHEWIRNATRAIPNYAIPDPVKYDERTWEAVVRDGYLASAVLLAISFERNARDATSQEEGLAYARAAYQVYDELLGRETSKLDAAPPFWHKNFGLVAGNLYSATGEERYKAKKWEQWLKYINSGADDPQIPDMIAILKGEGAIKH